MPIVKKTYSVSVDTGERKEVVHDEESSGFVLPNNNEIIE